MRQLLAAAASPSTGGLDLSGSSGGGSGGGGGAAAPARRAAKPGAKRKPAAPALKKGAYAHLAAAAGGADPRLCLWEPPVSPFGLIEEELFEDPWKLLLACMLLNKTSGKQVRQVIWRLFDLCPTPQAVAAADQGALRDLIRPLGLFNKRAAAVQRFSREYVEKEWSCPTELHGIGKYAADAYYMFCRGAWRGVAPDDKDLRRYWDWLAATGGEGAGLQRGGGGGGGGGGGAPAGPSAEEGQGAAAEVEEEEEGCGGAAAVDEEGAAASPMAPPIHPSRDGNG
ncbi:MAG: DNA glycosylase [Monoraphidium minutum]|nr:MAG: DNA glycosylase [Monoraphidium minutum]